MNTEETRLRQIMHGDGFENNKFTKWLATNDMQYTQHLLVKTGILTDASDAQPLLEFFFYQVARFVNESIQTDRMGRYQSIAVSDPLSSRVEIFFDNLIVSMSRWQKKIAEDMISQGLVTEEQSLVLGSAALTLVHTVSLANWRKGEIEISQGLRRWQEIWSPQIEACLNNQG